MLKHFRVGDKAVYPAQGVAEVMGIESREVSGNQETFYMLRLLDSDRRIMIPLNKAPSVGLRQVIGCDQVPEVFGLLRTKPARLARQNWNRRYRGYIEKLKELDVTGVEPTAHAVPMVNVTRADEIRPSLPHDDALRNAPKQASGLFIVPKIVE